MTRCIFASIFALITLCSNSQTVTLPQASSTQTLKQNFGLGSIELSYSRPSLKNRVAFKELSELAPIDKIWRTGANGATTLTFNNDVLINNVAVKAGKYGLLSIPGKKSFTLIISKDIDVSQPTAYKVENDLLRYTATISKLNEKVETFTIQFANITYSTCDLQISWGNTLVTLPIVANVKDKIKADIEKSLDSDKPALGSIATYYYEIEKDYTKALEYATKAISSKPSYGLFLLKAKIEKEIGDKASAKVSAEKCIDLAKTANNDDVVRSAKELINKL